MPHARTPPQGGGARRQSQHQQNVAEHRPSAAKTQAAIRGRTQDRAIVATPWLPLADPVAITILIGAPCRAEIMIDLPVPQSWSTKRRDAALCGDIRPTSRPDADNYIKAALD